ncbi:MAG: integrase core domain-containing protein [Thermotogota bacterium]|nr:integrase core domain-containing protein [Thermotogota bacterium]
MDIKHRRTQVARPKTNGKVEQFFRTIDDELHDRYHFDCHKNGEMVLKDYLRMFRKYRMQFSIDGLTPREKCVNIAPINVEPHIQKYEVKVRIVTHRLMTYK